MPAGRHFERSISEGDRSSCDRGSYSFAGRATAHVAIVARKQTAASQSRLRTSTRSSTIDRIGRNILAITAAVVINSPNTQKTREIARLNRLIKFGPPLGRFVTAYTTECTR